MSSWIHLEDRVYPAFLSRMFRHIYPTPQNLISMIIKTYSKTPFKSNIFSKVGSLISSGHEGRYFYKHAFTKNPHQLCISVWYDLVNTIALRVWIFSKICLIKIKCYAQPQKKSPLIYIIIIGKTKII
jgi:hypothetical protein